MTTNRDSKTGRFARRPVPDVDAESSDPIGDSIEDIEDVSGTPSANTIERPRYAPDADELAQGGQGSPLRARRPELVHPDDGVHAIYGSQGAVLRTAARGSGPMGPTPYLTGLEGRRTPTAGVKQVTDDYLTGVQTDVRGDLRPVSRGMGRGRDR